MLFLPPEKSILIMKEKPSLNRNIRSALLHLFNKLQLRFLSLFGSSLLGFFYLDFKLLHYRFWQKKLRHVWRRLKVDLHDCWPQDIAIALCLVMTLVLISCCFISSLSLFITRISSKVPLHGKMFYYKLMNCLKMDWRLSPKTSRDKISIMDWSKT